jgi:CheY-like chemotaxis protein
MVLDPAQRRAAARKLRIIVADDDKDAVMTLSTVLQHEGHEILEVYRADAVLEMARRYRPNIALLDIGMPGMTGFEIARQLKEELRHDCPVLIAVTAWSQSAAKELGKLVGFSHYLVKPYSTEDLLQVLAPLAASRAP